MITGQKMPEKKILEKNTPEVKIPVRARNPE